MTYGRAHLHKLVDGGLNLVVNQPPIGHHDDRVEDFLVGALQTNELVREPANESNACPLQETNRQRQLSREASGRNPSYLDSKSH